MNILGIDIGTTSISAVLLDKKTGALTGKRTVKNSAHLPGRAPFERIQDAKDILASVRETVLSLTDGTDLAAIGVTGQMHGILYLDRETRPVSPLFIWQDGRGNELLEETESYAAFLTRTTGYRAASGFGLTTHFYNQKNALVPPGAVKCSTIHDYLVFCLTGSLVTHASDAASLGFFNLSRGAFDTDALKEAGISPDFLPPVESGTVCAGCTHGTFLPDGIPVSVAIGDNQASFLGSVKDPEHSLLVNVGTGSQISFVTDSFTCPPCGEIRPLSDGKKLFVGSSLCGGRAYALLKDFFAETASLLGGSTDDLFRKMDALAEATAPLSAVPPLLVDCTFSGTRENPEKRGQIRNLGTDNFTPGALILGTLRGVAAELYGMYEEAAALFPGKPAALVGSGNGLRNSKIWRKVFEDTFFLPLTLPSHSEEAAVGACVFAAAAAKEYDSLKSAQNALLK